MRSLSFHTASACLLAVVLRAQQASANVGIFSYYETPIDGLGPVGPSQWPNLVLHDDHGHNECGGTGQLTGFGQSPIVFPDFAGKQCDSNFNGYSFEAGTCTWDDLRFSIENNSVQVEKKSSSSCSLGRMKIPDSSNYFVAKQIHIHTNSDHSVNGKYYKNEIHVVHQEEEGHSKNDEHSDGDHSGGHSEAEHSEMETGGRALVEDGTHALTTLILGMFIDVQDADNANFDYYLQGWEAAATQSEEFCAVKPEGSGAFVPNSIFTSRQMRVQCPKVADGVDASSVTIEASTGLPPLKNPTFPQGTLPNIYEDLTTGFGVYSYRGSWTTPPCSESVHWEFVDAPVLISQSQMDRLWQRILCFVERSTCRHATNANEFGHTNRPPQNISERVVLHRCENGTDIALAVPIPPTFQGHQQHEHAHWLAFVGILFPWFVLAVGIVSFFLLTRYMHFLPYTAVMFLIGTFMGIGIVSWNLDDQLSSSIRVWEGINSELLLIAFLPGLLFRDAYSMNVFLFQKGFFQCLIMAFPMVLAGTCLLALVGFYVLPYGWSWSLAMTFGAILSATDPVAVSALLNEVGAPPRLKVHISGESLLNDGSAIVFYTIFASKFLFELDIPGLGEDIDLARGVQIFFQMSLGAAAIGIAFALTLVQILYALNRRFNMEESIVQVTTTLTVAYLTFYVAEVICKTSGVIAVVVCGIVTSAFASSMINDQAMMEKFWSLTEHLLNTILFALGGIVWGTVISNNDKSRPETFSATDWGYLVLLYLLMTVVRFTVTFTFYPILRKIGLKSNWKEMFFLCFGGLRGAVGIALAISLDAEVTQDTLPGDPRRAFTSQLFGLTGGVALMTLVINGTLAGPLLRKLGLADAGEVRDDIVLRYRESMKHHLMGLLLTKLGETRFWNVDFALVEFHVPYLKGVSADEIKLSIRRNKESTSPHHYSVPNLESFIPFIGIQSVEEMNKIAKVSISDRLRSMVRTASLIVPNELSDEVQIIDEEKLVELRAIYIEILGRVYAEMMESGEVDSRDVSLVFVLQASLEVCKDEIANGLHIRDWEIAADMYTSVLLKTKDAIGAVREKTQGCCSKHTYDNKGYLKVISDVHRAVAFTEAHEIARERFKEEFCSNNALSASENRVLDESRAQSEQAEQLLRGVDKQRLEQIVSHLLCTVLLNHSALYIGKLVEKGMLKDQEGEEYFHHIEHDLQKVKRCAIKNKCGRKLKSLKDDLLEESARTAHSHTMGYSSGRIVDQVMSIGDLSNAVVVEEDMEIDC